jgi:beta-phosphoglucomutase
MTPFDSILFDFDGVLADTEPVHCACWAKVLSTIGITLTWDFYSSQCIGIDDRDMLRMLATQKEPPANWDEMWRLYPSKKQLFMARMISEPPFDAALDSFLRGLHGRYRLAVVSSSSRTEIEPMLSAGGLLQYFETIVGAESVTRYKPAPDPYLLAAERLKVSNPLVVEDSEAGEAAGRAAGFEVLRISKPAEVPAAVGRRLATCPD